jgi:hypothetical protein
MGGSRELVLNVPIAYWYMGPVSLVAGYQQKLDFFPLFIGCCGREVGYGSTDRSAVVLWILSGALLLGGSGSVQIY